MTTAAIPITGDTEADLLLEQDPLALLIGMLLDQQVPMEWAFKGPHTLRDRLDGGSRVVVRPGGTEPKRKAYLDAAAPGPGSGRDLRARATAAIAELEAGVRQLLGV